MKKAAAIALFWIAAAVPAMAQAPAPRDSVTVTGTQSREVITRFVESVAAPTRMTGKIARWETGICPVAVGLRPSGIAFVTQRLKDVATAVGAPVSRSPSCKPNIEIVFTTKPQALADTIKKDNPGYLGWYDNQDQLQKLATVTRPIQAWYTTATKDLRGKTTVDSARIAGAGTPIELPCGTCTQGKMLLFYAASAGTVTGSRLGDGMRSNLYHVIIAVEPSKLVEQEMGALADYIAMLALSQISSLDVCQGLPSITNLLVPDCANTTTGMTANDQGYLRGLYHMNAERALRSQADEIVHRISQEAQNAQ